MKPRVSKEEHSGQGTPECGITWCAWELAEAGERDQGTEEVGKAEAGSCRVPGNTGGGFGICSAYEGNLWKFAALWRVRSGGAGVAAGKTENDRRSSRRRLG